MPLYRPVSNTEAYEVSGACNPHGKLTNTKKDVVRHITVWKKTLTERYSAGPEDGKDNINNHRMGNCGAESF